MENLVSHGYSEQSIKQIPRIFGILLSRALLEIAGVKDDFPGTPKDMGPPYGKRDPYYSHIFRDSNMGVGLGNSMGVKGSHSWGS